VNLDVQWTVEGLNCHDNIRGSFIIVAEEIGGWRKDRAIVSYIRSRGKVTCNEPIERKKR
jgi:hypothetical protein